MKLIGSKEQLLVVELGGTAWPNPTSPLCAANSTEPNQKATHIQYTVTITITKLYYFVAETERSALCKHGGTKRGGTGTT